MRRAGRPHDPTRRPSTEPDVLLILMNVLGGVALILFGIRFLRKGLDRLVGRRLAGWVQRATRTRPKAFGAGLGVSTLICSSTSIFLLSLQMVRDRHASPRNLFAFVIGADVGLTALVLLGSLHIDAYAVAPIALGVLAFQFMRNDLARGVGQVVLSLGFILLGIHTIRDGAALIQPQGDLAALISIAERYPVLLAGVGAALSIAMQSSTASILLVVGLSANGSLGLTAAVPAIVGANVGTGLTMLMLGWRTAVTRQLALCNLTAKLLTAVVVLVALPFWSGLLTRLPLAVEQQAALGHTGFNVLLATLVLPFAGLIYTAVARLAPEPPAEETEGFAPRHLDETPPPNMTVGLAHAMREVLHVSEITRAMMADFWTGLKYGDTDALARVAELDDRVDQLDRVIKRYLVKLLGESGEDDASGEVIRQMRFLSEYETIGDILDRNLAELALKKTRTQLWFSEETYRDLERLFLMVQENMLIAETAFHTFHTGLAEQLIRHKTHLNHCYRESRDRFLERVQQGDGESLDASAIYLDILANLRQINSGLTHVAYAITGGSEDPAVATHSARVASPEPLGPVGPNPSTSPAPA